MTSYPVFWPDVSDADSVYRGPEPVRAFITDSLFFTVAATAAPVLSGPFAVVPSRHTVTATGNAYEGVWIFWIQEGKTALQAYAQGD